ncbi:PIG-L family deacetylase [Subtercola frigoramans]|uniref:LmbE family N-acetylglucosaminyl deacetylase n=1 Tax=Subtercola frigoramans TaxID=120298 RepID=A0ABS2L6J3_9MICO|nr:PIG-L family deacetylase [Subtercola frigoramans]MBM7472355.1 LmbE family N-acetylglucosaminyl deacetylase [Subtercola frigoramans]
MVSFDARDAGTSQAVWQSDPRLDSLGDLELDGFDRVVVVSAHPDDETLGAGGLIAECALRSIEVSVIVVTDGSASHPGSPSFDREALARWREGEVREAITILAPHASIRTLAFEDGNVDAAVPAIRDAVSLAVGTDAGETVLLVAPWRGDGHHDHELVGRIAAEISSSSGCGLAEYPIWMWHWANPDDPAMPWDDLASLQLSPSSLAAKTRAVSAHRSQVAPLSDQPGDEALLRPDFLEHFTRPSEIFVVSSPESHRVSLTTLPAAYFDETYDLHPDPWGFTDRWYEERKRAVTVASLPQPRYGYGLEIGCSIGVLTQELAARCDRLLGVDISEAAVARACERLVETPNVEVQVMDVGKEFPSGSFDLVVLSEVGYYFSPDRLDGVLHDIEVSLTPEGTLVACHWRYPVGDYLQSGDEVHRRIAANRSWHSVSRHEEKDFVLEVFTLDGRSVAEQTGLR